MSRQNRIAALALVGLTALTGCATMPHTGPVDVTRYHLGYNVDRTAVALVPAGRDAGPEFQFFANAVGAELQRAGFQPLPPQAGDSPLVAVVAFTRTSAGLYQSAPPVTIGLGGSSFSGGYHGGSSIGAGGSFDVGSQTYEMITDELAVQLRRRSDNTIVWEGRAHSTGANVAPDMQPATAAPRLAAALFRDFPGELGVTITVK